MKMFIDTSNKDLFVSLVQHGKTINYKLIKNLVKKAEALPKVFKEVIQDKKAKEITDFYITLGPGSFTGARTALVFARSICQITKANLHTTSSAQFIAGPINNHKIYIDARSQQSYFAEVKDGNLVKDICLVAFQTSSLQNFDLVINSPKSYFPMFKIEKDILSVKPYYVKDARIGK